MKLKRNTGLILISVFLFVLAGGWVVDRTFAKGDDFYETIIRFDDILRKIKTNYVVDVPAESLVVYGVGGMRDILDPHTSYFEEKEFDNLMIHTKGEFGGLGITIGLTENVLTIISPLPIPGSPAMKVGLMAGDRILKIDGKSTEGIQLDEAVNKLRGPKGTPVTITIERDGVGTPFDVELERDIIKIQSVLYRGLLDEKAKIGYLNLVNFTQVSSREVEDAVRHLNGLGVKACILDLRNNPGGLLKEAVGVAEKFLPAGKLIVYTQGRNASQKQVFEAGNSQALAGQIPLLVLVNQGSASASEIVAGAIQDHDRGVIMGNETFGKGSVQTILPLEQKRALKLTTAYYYTPSGRCINKISNDVGARRHQAEAEEEEQKKDTAKAKPKKEEYKTLGLGRTVYGGGGITPDLDVEPDRIAPIEIEIIRKSHFFKFATSELARLKAKNAAFREDTFHVTDEIYANFLEFLKKKEFSYESPEQKLLKDFRKLLDRSRRDLSDTSKIVKGPYDADIDREMKALEDVLARDRDHAFTRHKALIRDRLAQAFLIALPNQDPYYRYVLSRDKYVTAAIALLKDKKRYDAVLSRNFKKATP